MCLKICYHLHFHSLQKTLKHTQDSSARQTIHFVVHYILWRSQYFQLLFLLMHISLWHSPSLPLWFSQCRAPGKLVAGRLYTEHKKWPLSTCILHIYIYLFSSYINYTYKYIILILYIFYRFSINPVQVLTRCQFFCRICLKLKAFQGHPGLCESAAREGPKSGH